MNTKSDLLPGLQEALEEAASVGELVRRLRTEGSRYAYGENLAIFNEAATALEASRPSEDALKLANDICEYYIGMKRLDISQIEQDAQVMARELLRLGGKT